MRKRLMIGLLAGGLMVGMLPGVASADPPGERDGHGAQFSATVTCQLIGGGQADGFTIATWAGVQGQLEKAFNAFLRSLDRRCVPGTKEITLTKLS